MSDGTHRSTRLNHCRSTSTTPPATSRRPAAAASPPASALSARRSSAWSATSRAGARSSPPSRTEMHRARRRAPRRLAQRLEQLLQDDTTAYNGVIDAYKHAQGDRRRSRRRARRPCRPASSSPPTCRSRSAAWPSRSAASRRSRPSSATRRRSPTPASARSSARPPSWAPRSTCRINLGSIKDAAYVAHGGGRDRRDPGRGRGAARRGPRHHALQALNASPDETREGAMAAQIIDGKAIAEQVREEIKAEVAKLATGGVKPGVATILVGDDGGAQFYRGQIEKNTGDGGLRLLQQHAAGRHRRGRGARSYRQAQRRPRRARHPGAHADGRRHRPEHGVQRHRARQGPRLREPGQHRPRAARRPAVRAGDAHRPASRSSTARASSSRDST